MTEIDEIEDMPKRRSDQPMTREEIIKAVTESGPVSEGRKRFLVIPSMASEEADFQEIARGLDPGTDPGAVKIIEVCCGKKNAGFADIKALIHRLSTLRTEQLDIVDLICRNPEFNVKSVLRATQSIKKVGLGKVLALRAFVELENLGPGPLNRFFNAVLPPEPSLREKDPDAYERAMAVKMMRPDQVTAFYTVCSQVPGITHGNAILVLEKIRRFNHQHTHFLNTFLRANACFGQKSISDDTIPGLVNLLFSLPELADRDRFKKMVKRLSGKPKGKKTDFKYLISVFKETIEAEQGQSKGSFGSGLLNFLN